MKDHYDNMNDMCTIISSFKKLFPPSLCSISALVQQVRQCANYCAVAKDRHVSKVVGVERVTTRPHWLLTRAPPGEKKVPGEKTLRGSC